MDIQQILSDLRTRRGRLDQAIYVLEGLAPKRGPGKPGRTSAQPAGKRRRMSAKARKRIGEAKRRWWAERKAGRKRPHISAAGRKRLSELMKKRWAERKKKK